MGKKEKLIEELKSMPKDFSFDKAEALLHYLGYKRGNKGKTSGSRVEFSRPDSTLKIVMHKPHPGNELKEYQIKQLIEILKQEGLL